MKALDDIDRAILNQLRHNGRRINAELAALVGLSPSATLRRVRSLEDSGVIERYVTLIRREAAGPPYLVQVACADVEDYERIHRNHLSQLPGVSRIRSSFALRAMGQRTGFEL